MLHSKRIWRLVAVESPEMLAQKLTQITWTGCSAMELRGYLFANDSTSPDGAQEYAILKPHGSGRELVQIESVTFSWCREDRALELIRQICAGEFDAFASEYGRVAWSRFQTAAEHGFCGLCR